VSRPIEPLQQSADSAFLTYLYLEMVGRFRLCLAADLEAEALRYRPHDRPPKPLKVGNLYPSHRPRFL
jgi:hypothetical protein